MSKSGGLRRATAITTALLVALVLALVVLWAARPAEAAFPGENGKIAFASTMGTSTGPNDPAGDYEIFTMNKDGTGLTQLTFNNTIDWHPSFSANGSVLVFTSYRDGITNAPEIYLMDADGNPQIRLTTNTFTDDDPVLSPDGSKVAYDSFRFGNFEIIVLKEDVETNFSNNSANDSDPAWSPDGTKIAFTSNRDGNYEIYTMDASDGSALTNLTDNPATDFSPNWSPNGKKIVFTRDANPDPGVTNNEIFVMNVLDGSVKRRTRNAAVDESPAWSPNGKKIAFASTRDGDYEIFVMNADGTKPRKLTNNSMQLDEMPDWQPIVP